MTNVWIKRAVTIKLGRIHVVRIFFSQSKLGIQNNANNILYMYNCVCICVQGI